jgi:hypothetical protein
MKTIFFIILIIPLLLFSKEAEYVIGSELESDRSSLIALYHYRADAVRLNTARDFDFSTEDFVRHAAIDARDIYKARKGDVIRLEESYRDGKIFRVSLLSDKVRRKKYFVLSEDLKKLSLILPESS